MKYFFMLIAAVMAWLLESWGLMVVVGIVHNDWLPFIPAMGYGVALTIVGVVSLFMIPLYFIKGVIQGLSQLDI